MSGLRGYLNNFGTTLDGSITNVATSIPVIDATGINAQIIGTNGYVALTIDDGSDVEIVYCTSVSSNTLTVVRGREGTSGTAFATGVNIEVRPTRDSFQRKPFVYSMITSSQSITQNSLTTIDLITGAGGFDIGTSMDFSGNKLIPQVAGYYYIELTVSLESLADNKNFELFMDFNAGGSYVPQSWSQGSGLTMTTHRISTIALFNGSSDFMTFHVRHNDTTSRTIRQDASRLLAYRISEV